MVLDRVRLAVTANVATSAVTAKALADAKSALIAWSVTAYAGSGGQTTPGLLPFPDRNRDGNYDGKGDCVTFGLNPSHLLGRLPWAGDVSPCPRIGLHIRVRDGAGEGSWYAVSRNLVTRGDGGPINSDMADAGRARYPWITLRDGRGNVVADPDTGKALPIAAVLIAPGAPMDGQDRSAPASPPADYLDSIAIGTTVYSNADADGCPDASAAPCGTSPGGEEFIAHFNNLEGSGTFNDRLVTITVDELMRAVEKRVIGEVTVALNNYHDIHGSYPWLAAFRDPRTATFKSDLSRAGLLAVHLPGEAFATGFGGRWRFADATPTTTTRHSGDAMLVPPLVDGMSGAIRIAADTGRCRWSDSTRGTCIGSRMIPAFYRDDLGVTVTRSVEIAFDVVDDAPRITPPTAGDVRRRSLSINAATLPRLASSTWSVRITDYDGTNWGQRDVSIDADTGGEIVLSGIRYDLSVVYDDLDDARDELPEWFVENEWHQFIYVAVSQDAVPGGDVDGDGDCASPVNTCLTLKVEGRTARSDIRALVISAGARWASQDRTVGDCDGDGIYDDYLCAYLEGDNSDTSTPVAVDTYARDRYSPWFNDQLRIVEPLPP